MRLKDLNIKGFKSFADETVIHFNEAVTGIVGPNGSGKSNIVDAIRWVLGEQKGRELRLESMQDVIFNGTKKRREAPVAQVTLNFENTKNLLPTEYQNIAISRLLYRSGESEYRLNGVTCRLKDITGLFLDTGVGSDSYAIIALGMVEDILSNKENARRKMFEQAAGISKYKARKRESINKLKATNEDLARIEDLLFEINNNLIELEKQAKRTKKFFEMREKYKNTSTLLHYISVQRLQEKITGINAQIEEETIQVSEQEVKLRQAEADLEQFKKSHLDQEKSLSDFQKKVNEILDQIRLTESNIQVNEQKRNLHISQINQYQQNIDSANVKLSSIVKEIEELNLSSAAIETECLQKLDESQSKEKIYLERKAEYDELKTGVDQFHAEKQDLEKSIFGLEKELAIHQNQIDNFNGDSDRSNQELAAKTNEFKAIESHINEVNANLNSTQENIQNLSIEEEERLKTLAKLQGEVDQFSQQITKINRVKDAKKNEFDLLKSMVEKMEGFPESIKFLNTNWRNDVPVLSDLLYTDEKYRNAIELLLEPFLNYYVVRTEEEAVHAIRLLFSNGKGKANFFILDKIQKANLNKQQINGCTYALDLIETDALYQALFNHLLHDVYIMQDDKHLEDAVKFPDEITVISITGSILKQNNVISGGSVGLFEGKKLGRKKNLEKLEKEIAEIDLQSIDLDRNLTSLKNELKKCELQNKQQEILQLRKKETEYLELRAKNLAKQQHFNELKTQLEDRIAKNNNEIQSLQQIMQAKSTTLTELKIQNDSLMNSISESDRTFDKASVEMSIASNLFNQCKLEELKWQNKLDNVKKDLEFKQQQQLELKQTYDDNSNKSTDLDSEVKRLGEELAKNKTELEERYSFKKNMESDLSSLEREYVEIRNTITEFENNIRSTQKAIQDLQSSINTKKDQRSEFKYKIQSNYEKAEIEFGLKLDEFTPDSETEGMDEDQLRERAMYYKVRLDNYGEVNPLALEAYEEMKARHDKIQEQRTDIQKAQDSLLETIKEIEQTATEGFLNAFNQVRVHFQEVFRSLFTVDDDCDLILLDENDPLECDIDIIAKPKGKRPRSIHQLSGGEKTLTAIALLFSLYLLKPAPFCIFDEVDAPLDDVNIEKFNNIIRKFSKDSQFIIITHNKLTMAEVDILYGVYMEEQGISGVTAVDFRKYDHSVELETMES